MNYGTLPAPLEVSRATWTGLPVTLEVLPARLELQDIYLIDPSINLIRSGRGTRTLKAQGTTRELPSVRGGIDLLRGNLLVERASWDGELGQVLSVRLPAEALTRFLQDSVKSIDLKMLHDVADRELENLVEMLWGEASGGGSLGPMFVEGLSLALLGLVNSRYSQRQPQGRAEPGKLSPRDAKRVRAAIEAQLGDSLSIEKLAELLSMSPYYFSRTFKATFGQSPHAFVLDQRVDAACRALRSDKDRPIAEIANAVGFSSQSHLTETFRRRLGTTPARWRIET